MNSGKQLREKYRKGRGILKRNIKMPPVKDGSHCRRGKRWRGYFMCCGLAASRRPCPESRDGQVNRYGFVKNVFETPETETAARLTGCRNILEAEAIDDHTPTVKGWGTQLQTSRHFFAFCRLIRYVLACASLVFVVS